MVHTPSLDQIAETLAPIASEAGTLLLDAQKSSQGVTRRGITRKDDGTPTCPADTQSEGLIVARLRERFPAIPIVSEERVKDAVTGSRFFLVDPLDGTADFIDGGREFCVNIAMVENGRPIAAVIHAPASATTWLAGETAFMTEKGTSKRVPLTARLAVPGCVVALTSDRYGDIETESSLAQLNPAATKRISSALKFCLIAAGEADVYIRHGRTMQWDTGAGDLILTRSGGTVIGLDGAPLTYGPSLNGYANPAFVALGDPSFATKALSACRAFFGPR